MIPTPSKYTLNEVIRSKVGSNAISEELMSAELDRILSCTITNSQPMNPYITIYGDTYDKNAIKEWLLHKQIDPLNGKELTEEDLIPNRALPNFHQPFLRFIHCRITKKYIKELYSDIYNSCQIVNDFSLCCPITKKPMKDPVICQNCVSYERKAIKQYLEIYETNPITGKKLKCSQLIPNKMIRDINFLLFNMDEIQDVNEYNINFNDFASKIKSIKEKEDNYIETAFDTLPFYLIPEKYITNEMYEREVAKNGSALKHVPNEHKTYELCIVAVSKNGWALKYVNLQFQKMEVH